jgi:hypothetical protein
VAVTEVMLLVTVLTLVILVIRMARANRKTDHDICKVFLQD